MSILTRVADRNGNIYTDAIEAIFQMQLSLLPCQSDHILYTTNEKCLLPEMDSFRQHRIL